jgi:hypothetical protein
MKKVSELTRPVLPTTTKEGNDRVITEVSLSNRLTISETAKSVLREMDKNTPSNELLLRGWS